MRPTWKNIDDHVHFALQTHTEEGRPIDFTGAQLHISLMDAKAAGSATVIGSNSLNLAHLIIVSRDKHQKLKSRRPQKPPRSKSGRLQEMKVRENVGEVRNDGNNPTDHPPSHQQRPGPPNRAPLNRAHSTRAPLGYQIVSQPSPALRSIAAALSSPSQRKPRKKGLDEFGIKSFRLRETLIEGGLVVGHINCDIDVWWM
eukprot:jgi/Psemu1/226010/e_gw1.1708.7.1